MKESVEALLTEVSRATDIAATEKEEIGRVVCNLMDDVKARKKDAEDAVASLTEKLDAKERKILGLQAELDGVQTERRRLGEQVDVMTQSLAQAAEKEQILESAKIGLRSEVDMLQTAIDAERRQVASLHRQVALEKENAHAQNEMMKVTVASVKQQLASLQAEKQVEDEELERLQRQLEHTCEKLKESEKKRSETDAKLVDAVDKFRHQTSMTNDSVQHAVSLENLRQQLVQQLVIYLHPPTAPERERAAVVCVFRCVFVCVCVFMCLRHSGSNI